MFERHNEQQREYFRRDRPRMRPGRSRYLQRHVDALVRFGELRPGERVLEVGCGMGRYTFLLADAGLRMEGMDLSSELLEHLTSHARSQGLEIPLHCSDVVLAGSALDGAFDAVVALFALHHVHSLDAVVASMARVLRPGGRVIFLEPNPYSPLYYAQILITPGMSWHAERGILEMRPSRMAEAMSAAGLRRTRYARFGFFPPFIANRALGARLEDLLQRVPIWRALLPFQLFRGDLH